MKNDSLLNTKEAAKYLNVSPALLERDRWAGARIPFVKLGRLVRYRLDDLDWYINRQIRQSTSEGGS